MKYTIRAWCEIKGIKLKDLAKKSGVSYNAICQWKMGTRNPSLRCLKKVAEALGVEVDNLLV